jgi:hypothetical protein
VCQVTLPKLKTIAIQPSRKLHNAYKHAHTDHIDRPKVLAASSLPAKTNFNLYDAVLSTPTRQGSSASVAPPSPVDAEMERFLPLLQEYLKISDIELAAPAAEAKPRPPVRQDSGPEGDVGTSTRIGSRDEDDYVWDVYYYRPTLTQWNALALGGNVGSL